MRLKKSFTLPGYGVTFAAIFITCWYPYTEITDIPTPIIQINLYLAYRVL